MDRNARLLLGIEIFIAPGFGPGKAIGALHQLGKQVDPMESALVSRFLKNYDSRNAGDVCFKSTSVTREKALVFL